MPVATNLFASRTRIARLFGVTPAQLHETFQTRANQPIPPRYVESGPILDEVFEGEALDLALLPMLKHFDSDRGPYITNAIIIAEDSVTGIANMSYHRSMRQPARPSQPVCTHAGTCGGCCKPLANAAKNCAWRWCWRATHCSCSPLRRACPMV